MTKKRHPSSARDNRVPLLILRLIRAVIRLRSRGDPVRRMLSSLEMLGAQAPELRKGTCDRNSAWVWLWDAGGESEGLPYQAVLSTDCGMNCHKQCKDLVVFECKKRAKNSTAPTEISTSVGPTSNLCSLGAKDLLHGKQALGTFILENEVGRI